MTERFKKTNLLGKGGFGKVYEAMDITNGERVALKEMFAHMSSWNECCNLTEVKALQMMDHPNICKMKEVLLENGKLSLVYELLDKDVY